MSFAKDHPQTDKKARIVVVDDHPLLREGLIQLISRQPDMLAVGFADSVTGAEAAIEQCRPHLLLLDLRLEGGGDTLEFIKGVRSRRPDIRMLVISQCDEMLFAERCLRAGADGFVTKQEASAEVIEAIRAVLRGETYLSRKVAVLVFRHSIDANKGRQTAGLASLTDRQLHVFQLLGAGLGTQDIARELNLSVKTVESHREHIKQKLNAQNAADVARMAAEWAEGRGSARP
jgi:DNA-binding NarL/FixJ family response regulator